MASKTVTRNYFRLGIKNDPSKLDSPTLTKVTTQFAFMPDVKLSALMQPSVLSTPECMKVFPRILIFASG